MTNYEKIFAERLEAQRNAILGNKINEKLEIAKLNNKKLDEIYSAMETIVGKPVYGDFAYKSGRIMGVLRFMFQNPKYRRQLCELTGLSTAHVDLYYSVGGNLPYVDSNGVLQTGRKQIPEDFKELLQATAATLGVLLEPDDLNDISEERWKTMYDKALETAKQDLILKSGLETNTKYDE